MSPPAAALEPNPYEKERQDRIARNKQMLATCGLEKTADDLLKQAKPKPAPRAVQPRKEAASEPSRRSGRNAEKERPNYNEQQPLFVIEHKERRQRKIKKTSSSEGGKVAAGQYPAWHPGIPAPPEEVCLKAQAAAVKLVEELKKGDGALAKLMMASMVSKGFWLSVDSSFCKCLEVGDVEFICDDNTQPKEAFRNTQARRGEGQLRDDAWIVGLLGKTNKEGQLTGHYGFSKNWRGFAIDQFLHCDDWVVFEVLGKQQVKVHIFRAWDFADDAEKPEDLDAIRFQPLHFLQGTAEAAEGTVDVCSVQPSAAAAATSKGKSKRGRGCTDADADAPRKKAKTKPAAAAARLASSTATAAATSKGKSKRGRGCTDADAPRKKAKTKPAAGAAKPGSSTATAAAAGGGPAKAYVKLSSKTGVGSTAGEPSVTKARSSSSKCSTKELKGAAAAAETSQLAAAAAVQQQQQKLKLKLKPLGQKQTQQQKMAAAAAGAEAATEEQETFNVECIIGTKLVEGQRLFKVRWRGYGYKHDTWEPASSFHKPVREYDWKGPIPAGVA